jgi:hypothetical protein
MAGDFVDRVFEGSARPLLARLVRDRKLFEERKVPHSNPDRQRCGLRHRANPKPSPRSLNVPRGLCPRLGESNRDVGYGVAMDGDGNRYVADGGDGMAGTERARLRSEPGTGPAGRSAFQMPEPVRDAWEPRDEYETCSPGEAG